VSWFAAVFPWLHHLLGRFTVWNVGVGFSVVSTTVFVTVWSAAAGTLRLAAGSMSVLFTGVSVVSAVLSLYFLLWSKVVICFNVSVLVSFSGMNGLPVSGCCSACRMLVVALAMISAADAVGSLSFSGSQVSVLAMHSLFVLVIHVL